MIEFILHDKTIKIRSLRPSKVLQDGFVDSISVEYFLEVPDMVDGEGNPTTLNLGACGIIDVSGYKPGELIPFEELSEDYFHEIAIEKASTFPEVIKMIDHAKLVEEDKKNKAEPTSVESSNSLRHKFFKKPLG
jgi:hypothetical protein